MARVVGHLVLVHDALDRAHHGRRARAKGLDQLLHAQQVSMAHEQGQFALTHGSRPALVLGAHSPFPLRVP